MTSVFVGDLSLEVSEDDLLQSFSKIGLVLAVKVFHEAEASTEHGYGFVTFQKQEEAEAAVRLLNRKTLKGHTIQVNMADRTSLRHFLRGNVLVKNLERTVDSGLLQKTFAPYGHILSCKVPHGKKGSKCHGFVHFDSEEAATSAIKGLNGFDLCGKKIQVTQLLNRECRNGQPPQQQQQQQQQPLLQPHLPEIPSPYVQSGRLSSSTSVSTVYIKNLPPAVDATSLKSVCGSCGEVTSAKIIRDMEGNSKGFAFVTFKKIEEATKAIETLNGTELDGRLLFAGPAIKKASKRPRPLSPTPSVNAASLQQQQHILVQDHPCSSLLIQPPPPPPPPSLCKTCLPQISTTPHHLLETAESSQTSVQNSIPAKFVQLQQLIPLQLQQPQPFSQQQSQLSQQLNQIYPSQQQQQQQQQTQLLPNFQLNFQDHLTQQQYNQEPVRIETLESSSSSRQPEVIFNAKEFVPLTGDVQSLSERSNFSRELEEQTSAVLEYDTLSALQQQPQQMPQQEQDQQHQKQQQQQQQQQCTSQIVNLYVKHLDDDVDDVTLKAMFARYGEVISAKVMMEGDRSRGFGFVCFANAEDAARATRDMRGRVDDVNKKPLYVAPAQRKEERQAFFREKLKSRQQEVTLPTSCDVAVDGALKLATSLDILKDPDQPEPMTEGQSVLTFPSGDVSSSTYPNAEPTGWIGDIKMPAMSSALRQEMDSIENCCGKFEYARQCQRHRALLKKRNLFDLENFDVENLRKPLIQPACMYLQEQISNSMTTPYENSFEYPLNCDSTTFSRHSFSTDSSRVLGRVEGQRSHSEPGRRRAPEEADNQTDTSSDVQTDENSVNNNSETLTSPEFAIAEFVHSLGRSKEGKTASPRTKFPRKAVNLGSFDTNKICRESCKVSCRQKKVSSNLRAGKERKPARTRQDSLHETERSRNEECDDTKPRIDSDKYLSNASFKTTSTNTSDKTSGEVCHNTGSVPTDTKSNNMEITVDPVLVQFVDSMCSKHGEAIMRAVSQRTPVSSRSSGTLKRRNSGSKRGNSDVTRNGDDIEEHSSAKRRLLSTACALGQKNGEKVWKFIPIPKSDCAF